MKLLFLLLFLNACIQPSNYRNQISDNSFTNSFQQCFKGVLPKDDIVKKIEIIGRNANKLYQTLDLNTQLAIELVNVSVIDESLTPFDPLILSREYFEEKYNDLFKYENLLDPHIWNFLIDGINLSTIKLSQEEIQIIAEIVKKYRILPQIAQRWMQMHCNVGSLEDVADHDIRLHPDFNPIEYQKNINSNSFLNYFYHSFGEDLFNIYFSLKIIDRNRKFTCQINGQDSIQMTILVWSQENFPQIKNAIEKFWNRSGYLKIKIILAESKAKAQIRFSIRKNLISHSLKVGGNEVFFNPELFNNFSITSEQIIAHEFGHALGFSDCYMEFFDSDYNLVNYSLMPSNLMCSLEGIVPDHYFLQVKNNLCVVENSL